MKNLWKSLIVMMLVLSLVSACGTRVDNEQTSDNKTEKQDDQTTNGSLPENNQDNDSSEEPKKDDEQIIRLFEQLLTYTVDGKQYEETGFLQKSENQKFSLYVLENWELHAEEPNSDVLTRDDSFVRIRLIDSEVDYSKTVEEYAKAVSSDAQQANSAEFDGIWKDAVWWKAYTEDTAVNVLWIKEKVPMLLTIHTPRNEEKLEPIFAMIETLEKDRENTSQGN